MIYAWQLANGGSAPATLGFTAVAPEWLSYRAANAAPAIPAAESTLGSHPCVALSSAQVLPEWTNRTPADNAFASNGDNPLNFVSHSRGSLQTIAFSIVALGVLLVLPAASSADSSFPLVDFGENRYIRFGQYDRERRRWLCVHAHADSRTGQRGSADHSDRRCRIKTTPLVKGRVDFDDFFAKEEHMVKASLVLMVAALLAPSAVRADLVLEQSFSLPLTQAPATVAIPFNGFNPALGTLNFVDLSGGVFATVVVDLFNPTPDTVDMGSIHVVRTFFGTFGSDYVEMILMDDYLLPGGASVHLTDTEFDFISSSLITSPNDLQAFISTGTIQLPMLIDSVDTGNTGELVANVESTAVSADLTLAYDYTPAPIPEPSSGILIITVLAAVGLVWLRRHNSLRV